MADEIELKGTTPDDTVDTNAVLIGADTASSTAPVLFQIADIWSHLRSLSNTWSGTQTFSGDVAFEQTPTVNGSAVATSATAAIAGGAYHDGFSDFVANEHINHTSVSITAGTGLTGGGTIAASRTISLSHLGIQSLTDPNADRIMFWDDSAGAMAWLTAGTGLTLSGTTLSTTDWTAATANFSTSGSITSTGGTLNLGVNDTTRGLLRVYGGATSGSAAELRFYNTGDQDTTEDYWTFKASFGDIFIQGGTTNNVGLALTDDGRAWFADVNYVEIGRADTHPGGMRLYGGGTGESGAFVRMYQNADDDSTNEYINVLADNGGLVFELASGSDILVLNEARTIQLSGYGSGSLQTDASGNVTASSDERLKTDIVPFSRGLEAVRAIDPISYKWSAASGFDVLNSYSGFSAQNVEAAIPEAVGMGPSGHLSLSDRPIIAALVNAVKELATRVEQLEAQP